MTEVPFSSTHPQLPPTTEEDRLARLRLLRSRRVGVSTFHRLMGEHGSAEAALAALPELASQAGEKKYTPCSSDAAMAELRAGQAAGARLIAFGDPEYPDLLSQLPDAPPLLWAKGDISILARPCVALVGARNASSLGIRMARRLARDLGEAGYIVASGLARGIDTAAHGAALDTGTIAVFAGGIDVFYPAENTQLGALIARKGLCLSEVPVGTVPQARHFPARNRIISGLARATVVVEAAARSGSLITARDALDQGRDVMAVPGHPFDARASGCNMLIRDGATLVRNATDVIEALDPIADTSRHAEPVQPPTALPEEAPSILRHKHALHMQILDRLSPSPLAEDQLIRDIGQPAAEVAPVLIDLELDGQIRRSAGGLLTRAAKSGPRSFEKTTH